MSIGTIVRKILGPKLFSIVGRRYRKIFVDLEKVTQAMCHIIPEDGYVLDIGGGGGGPLNSLLSMREDINVTMLDLSSTIGNSIFSEYQDRVHKLPETTVREYMKDHLKVEKKCPDCIMINDVIHHIPVWEREQFFRDLCELVKNTRAMLIIKDVEPGYFISYMGYLSDRYVSHDKTVSLISKTDLSNLIHEVFGEIKIEETKLFFTNRPNYSIIVYEK